MRPSIREGAFKRLGGIYLSFIKRYLLPRLLQYFLVIFVGITVVFIVPRLTPVDPVQEMIYTITQRGAYMDPEAIEQLRQSMKEMYGLEGTVFSLYISLWRRLIIGDFGPSLSQFPTPVVKLIGISLPWTLVLMLVTTLLSCIIGNILGGIAGYFSSSRWAAAIERFMMVLRPIPYYIFALILLLVFGYVIPIFPIAGGTSIGLKIQFSWKVIADLLRHAIQPALSMILLGMAGWFQTMRLVMSNIVREDYVMYARAGGLRDTKIAFNYVIKNAMLPQVTGLALSLGQIFGGAMVTVMEFSYPGIGGLLYTAINAGDYNLIMGITMFSILGIATGALLVDLLYPLFDPRIRYR